MSPYACPDWYSETGTLRYALTYGHPTFITFRDEHGQEQNGRIMSRLPRFDRDLLPSSSPFFKGFIAARVEGMHRYVIPVNPFVFPYFDAGDYLIIPSPDTGEFFVTGFTNSWSVGLQWITDGTLAPGVTRVRGCSLPGENHTIEGIKV